MKNRLKYLLSAVIAAVCAVSCEKDEIVIIDPIGVYEFDGVECEIVDGRFIEDDETYCFAFSPQLASSRSTILYLGLAKYFGSGIVNVENMYHNDDYYFSYEDPVHFYSHYRSLRSGTMRVEYLGNDEFEVMANVVLPDGKPFVLDFSGKLERVKKF